MFLVMKNVFDPTLTKLINAACRRLNPIAGMDVAAESDAVDLIALADAVEARPDDDFPIEGVSLPHARQLVDFIRAQAA